LNYTDAFYDASIQHLLTLNLIRVEEDDLIINGNVLSTLLSGTLYNNPVSFYHVAQAVAPIEVGPFFKGTTIRVTTEILKGLGFDEAQAVTFFNKFDGKEISHADIAYFIMFGTPNEVAVAVEKPKPEPVVVSTPAPTVVSAPNPVATVFNPVEPVVAAVVAPVVTGGPFSPNPTIAVLEAQKPSAPVEVEVKEVQTMAGPVTVFEVTQTAEVVEPDVEKVVKKRAKKEKAEVAVPKPPGGLNEVYAWVESYFLNTVVASSDFRFSLEDYLCRAETAFKNYEPAQWYDSQGTPIQNWKMKIIQNWFSKMVKAPFGYRPLNYTASPGTDPNAAENAIIHVKNEKGLDSMTIEELRLFVEHPKADFAAKAAANQKLSGAIAYKNSDILDFTNGKLDILKLSKTRIEQLLEWSETPMCEPQERQKLRDLLSIV
jgi:hypothetical protein